MRTMLPSPTIRIVVCGNADGGDDGVALSAAATLLPTLSARMGATLEVRRRPELRVEDLVDLRSDERCLIIDAVSGIDPGEIVVVPLQDLRARPEFSPRSTHELPIELVLALAGIIREQTIEGAFVGLGGRRFGYGTPISRAVRAAMPAFRDAIADQLTRLTGAGPTKDSTGCLVEPSEPARACGCRSG